METRKELSKGETFFIAIAYIVANLIFITICVLISIIGIFI